MNSVKEPPTVATGSDDWHEMHRCVRPTDCGSMDGSLLHCVSECIETADGKLFVTRPDFDHKEDMSTQVDFCPFCGTPARKKINDI